MHNLIPNSQNAEELLGLSPRYLFSLECFTDTLPESQAGTLWDNIQFLSESDPNSEDEEGSPHVFLLTGWGAPGSAAPDDQEASNGRRAWTCWCAVHRPASIDPTVASQGLIIMEFELEQDALNPLYRPFSSDDPTVSIGTPLGSASTDGEGSSTDGSEETCVGGPTTPDSSALNVAAVSGGGTNSPSDQPPSDVGEVRTDSAGPTAEQILESTTSRAKPLLALERLRRIARGEAAASGGTSPRQESRSKRSRRMGGGANGVGMMDVFAVMAQINEQLGAAPDLDAFLKVVVGVIKDLSRFHRVLVYQFDEAWNGQVVAELLDYSKTQELYRGLHFPASDIPQQVSKLPSWNDC